MPAALSRGARPDAAITRHVSRAGEYAPPSGSTSPSGDEPPQTSISDPVHTAVGSFRALNGESARGLELDGDSGASWAARTHEEIPTRRTTRSPCQAYREPVESWIRRTGGSGDDRLDWFAIHGIVTAGGGGRRGNKPRFIIPPNQDYCAYPRTIRASSKDIRVIDAEAGPAYTGPHPTKQVGRVKRGRPDPMNRCVESQETVEPGGGARAVRPRPGLVADPHVLRSVVRYQGDTNP